MPGIPALPEALRRELLDYLLSSSSERAQMIAKLSEQSPSVAKLLIDLESDDELRTTLERNLLNQ